MNESSKHPSLITFIWDFCCWSCSSASCLWLTPSCPFLLPLTVDHSGNSKMPKAPVFCFGTWSYCPEIRRPGHQQKWWNVSILHLVKSLAMWDNRPCPAVGTHAGESTRRQQGKKAMAEPLRLSGTLWEQTRSPKPPSKTFHRGKNSHSMRCILHVEFCWKIAGNV